jgi:hypothetical protein
MSCTQAYPANLVKLSYMPPPQAPAAITLQVAETIETLVAAACSAVHAIAQALTPTALATCTFEIAWRLAERIAAVTRQALKAALLH